MLKRKKLLFEGFTSAFDISGSYYQKSKARTLESIQRIESKRNTSHPVKQALGYIAKAQHKIAGDLSGQ